MKTVLFVLNTIVVGATLLVVLWNCPRGPNLDPLYIMSYLTLVVVLFGMTLANGLFAAEENDEPRRHA